MTVVIPATIETIFEKPGSQWPPECQTQVVEWLFDSAQLNYLLRFSLYHLGPKATNEDAEDAWEEFCTSRLPSVIRFYDPKKGRRFWNYLLLCLQNECGHSRKKLHKRVRMEQPLQFTHSTGEDEIEVTFEPDAGNNPVDVLEVKNLIAALKSCLELLPVNHRKAFSMVVLAESGYDQASKTLREEPGTVRVWVCRARAALKKCLNNKGWN